MKFGENFEGGEAGDENLPENELGNSAADGRPEAKERYTLAEIDDKLAKATMKGRGKMSSTEEKPAGYESARKQILEEFGDDCPSFLNLKRAENFVESMGLETKPVVLVGNNGNYINFILQQCGIPGVDWSQQEGFSSDALGINFVQRNRELEDANGFFQTERNIVHELFHGTSDYKGFITKPKLFGSETGSRREGFCLPSNPELKPYGWFLEEGFAELMATRYTEQFADWRYREAVEKATGTKFDEKMDIDGEEGAYQLPVKYLMSGSNGEILKTASTEAGYAIELLCQAVPGLEAHLIEARKSASGLKKVFKDIESISPGLYLQLQKGAYDEASFVKKLALVEEKIKEYNSKKQYAASEGAPPAEPAKA